jgi:outer membrane protein TolC
LDEAQSESQAATARANLVAAYGTLDADENALKNLITDHYTEWHKMVIKPSDKLLALPEVIDIQESWQKGLMLRPDFLQAKVDLQRKGITLRYQRNQLLPQLDLVGSYGRSGLKSDLGGSLDDIKTEAFPFYFYGATLSIPLDNRTARYNYRATKALIDQLLANLKKVEQNVLVQIDNSVKAIRTDFESVQANREAVKYAEQALQAEQKKLEVGKSTSFVVLQLQSNLTAARAAEIRALANYNEDLSRLAQNEGSTLEKYHIDVKAW